jgi:hypothetical protein
MALTLKRVFFQHIFGDIEDITLSPSASPRATVPFPFSDMGDVPGFRAPFFVLVSVVPGIKLGPCARSASPEPLSYSPQVSQSYYSIIYYSYLFIYYSACFFCFFISAFLCTAWTFFRLVFLGVFFE